jgi:hypothetical protein
MKTRDIKELLILLRDNIDIITKDPSSPWGMCALLMLLYNQEVVTEAEHNKTITFLGGMRPEGLDHLDFWFEPGEQEPRLEWLNEQIAKL